MTIIPKELQIPILDAKAIYEVLPPNDKQLTMKTNFSRDITIPIALTDIITSWENYLEYTQQDEKDILPHLNPVTDEQRRFNADAKLTRIIKLLNEGWYPDWNNSNEYKYAPYFDMRTKTENGFAFRSSGFAFRSSGYAFWDTFSSVGSGFVLKTAELAEFMGKTFLSEYKDKMTL